MILYMHGVPNRVCGLTQLPDTHGWGAAGSELRRRQMLCALPLSTLPVHVCAIAGCQGEERKSGCQA